MLYKGAPPFSMSALYIIMNFNPRARGLKPVCTAGVYAGLRSRPAWGAWIETVPPHPHAPNIWSRPVWGPVWGATATGVTTSPFCHVFMGIPLHKYDFLGT